MPGMPLERPLSECGVGLETPLYYRKVKMDKTYMMLACPILRREISAFVQEQGLRYPIFYVPDELHLFPEKLKEFLCDFIPRLSNVDYLLLPMGRCGNGTVGIPSGSTTLVLPKCEDCISLLLSTDSLADVDRCKYSFYFTDGYLDIKNSFTNEYEYTVNKYGKELGDELMQTMYKHYKYFTYLETGFGDFDFCREQVLPLAKTAEVEIDQAKAPFGVLRKMLTLDFDNDFLLVPPGQIVEFDLE